MNDGRRIRRWRHGLAACAALLALAGGAAAARPDPNDPAADVLTIGTAAITGTVYQGRGTVVTVPLRLKAGWHVPANPCATGYIATELLKVKCGPVRFGTRRYPPGRPFTLAGTAEALSVYEGDFQITFAVVAPPTTISNAWQTIQLELHYQPCDATTCYPARSIPIDARIRILPAPRSSRKR